MLDHLQAFYLSACTIQQKTETQGTYGNPIISWATLPEHADLPCSVAPAGQGPGGAGDVIRSPDNSYTISTHNLALQGHYPAIRAGMRAVVAGQTYDILHPAHSVHTVLRCQVVA